MPAPTFFSEMKLDRTLLGNFALFGPTAPNEAGYDFVDARCVNKGEHTLEDPFLARATHFVQRVQDLPVKARDSIGGLRLVHLLG